MGGPFRGRSCVGPRAAPMVDSSGTGAWASPVACESVAPLTGLSTTDGGFATCSLRVRRTSQTRKATAAKKMPVTAPIQPATAWPSSLTSQLGPARHHGSAGKVTGTGEQDDLFVTEEP